MHLKRRIRSVLYLFALAVSGTGLVSCTYEPVQLSVPDWETGIQIQVQPHETFQNLSISWHGEILSPTQPPVRTGTEPFNIPDDLLENVPAQPCPAGIDSDGVIRCPAKDRLHPGVWEFTVEVLSDTTHLPGSPFVCTIELRRLWGEPGLHHLRVIEGGVGLAACVSPEGGEVPPPRVTTGLVALYTFEEGKENTVFDVSGVNPPLNLRVRNPDETIRPADAVSWGPGKLIIDVPTLVSAEGPGTKIIDRLMASNAITIEAWIKPANTTQAGPARIVTLSRSASIRNFTLGVEADVIDVRLRTDQTSNNGLPSLSTSAGMLTTNLTHVVYKRHSGGEAEIFVNGVEAVRNNIPGDFSSWDVTLGFALANEFSADRAWLGEYHLVAIYERALTDDEVLQNWVSGPVFD